MPAPGYVPAAGGNAFRTMDISDKDSASRYPPHNQRQIAFRLNVVAARGRRVILYLCADALKNLGRAVTAGVLTYMHIMILTELSGKY
jgi:hypothetical protein